MLPDSLQKTIIEAAKMVTMTNIVIIQPRASAHSGNLSRFSSYPLYVTQEKINTNCKQNGQK